jgi:hypothetical protein
MKSKQREILAALYRGEDWASDFFRKEYKRFVERRPEFRARRDIELWERVNPVDVLDYFIRVASITDLSNCPLTIEQMLHIVIIDVYSIVRRRWFEPRPKYAELTAARAENFSTIPSDLQTVFKYGDALELNTEQHLTPEYLVAHIFPPVEALATIQELFTNIEGYYRRDVIIRLIRQESPVNISLEGAADAVQSLKEDIIPWRKRHAKEMADLKARDAEVEIAKKRAEAAQIRANSAKDRAEVEKIEAEAAKLREEAEKQKIENDKLKFELESSKLQLAIDIVSKMRPDLPDSEKLVYAFKLLPSINTLTASAIEPKQIEEEERDIRPESEG